SETISWPRISIQPDGKVNPIDLKLSNPNGMTRIFIISSEKHPILGIVTLLGTDANTSPKQPANKAVTTELQEVNNVLFRPKEPQTKKYRLATTSPQSSLSLYREMEEKVGRYISKPATPQNIPYYAALLPRPAEDKQYA